MTAAVAAAASGGDDSDDDGGTGRVDHSDDASDGARNAGSAPAAVGRLQDPAAATASAVRAGATATRVEIPQIGVSSGLETLAVDGAGASLEIEVYRTGQSPKSASPSSEVYGNVPTPELRVITCGGAFDPQIGHYTDNLILFARLVG